MSGSQGNGDGWVDFKWTNPSHLFWPQPPSRSNNFPLSSVYYHCHSNMCNIIREHVAELHMSHYSIPLAQCARECNRTMTKIAHPQLACKEKPKGTKRILRTDSTTTQCRFIYGPSNASKNPQSSGKSSPTVKSPLSAIWWHQFVPTTCVSHSQSFPVSQSCCIELHDGLKRKKINKVPAFIVLLWRSPFPSFPFSWRSAELLHTTVEATDQIKGK